MEQNFKEFMYNYIVDKNIETEESKIFNLISTATYFIRQKPYFNDRFKHYLLKQNDEGEIRMISPYMNKIEGINNSILSGFVFSAHPESEYEDQFFSSYDDDKSLKTNIFITQKKIKNLSNLFKTIKKSESISDLNQNIQNLMDDNPDTFFDLHSIFPELCSKDREPIFDHITENTTIKSNYSEEYLISLNFHEYGEIKSKNKNKINNENFTEAKDLFLKSFYKKLSKTKSINFLLKENHNKLKELMSAINKEYPFLSNEVTRKDIKDLKFYFLEVPSFQHYNSIEEKRKINIKNLNSNLSSGTSINLKNEDINFNDFLFYSPFENNGFEKNISSAIDGLVYLKENEAKQSSVYDHCFFIAKNSKDETVAVLRLSKHKSLNKCYNINDVSVKYNYRKKGLSKILYSKVVDMAVANNILLFNRHYSENGKSFLPRMKQDLFDNNKDLIMINSHFGDVYDNEIKNEIIGNFNKIIESDVKDIDRNKVINYKRFNTEYRQILLDIGIISNKKNIDTFDIAHKLSNEFLKKDITVVKKNKNKLR